MPKYADLHLEKPIITPIMPYVWVFASISHKTRHLCLSLVALLQSVVMLYSSGITLSRYAYFGISAINSPT